MLRCKFICTLVAGLLLAGCASHKVMDSGAHRPSALHGQVVLGNENFLQNYLQLVEGKRVGLLTNPSGVNRRLRASADLFAENPKIQLTALFGPEHGIRGAVYAGEKVRDSIDPQTGVPVFSLYGAHRKPGAEMLSQVDILIIDIQDIGSRSYTYIYTMAMVMQAAAEQNIPVVVLDRPNPMGGLAVEGNLVEQSFSSFVGMYPIPYRHGMTIGELARLFNEEFGIHCSLTVVPMLNWNRSMYWGDTGLPWVPTSPHIPHWQSTLFYCATGTFGELRTLSEGVGYTSPFEMVGAPWIDGYRLAAALNDLHIPGVLFRPIVYKPYYATFKGQLCAGVQLHITDYRVFPLFTTGLYIVQTVRKLFPEHDLFGQTGRVAMFNKVMGTDSILADLLRDIPVPLIEQKWQSELARFKQIRQKYLIYQ